MIKNETDYKRVIENATGIEQDITTFRDERLSQKQSGIQTCEVAVGVLIQEQVFHLLSWGDRNLLIH